MGSFHQPLLVVCDPALLTTLPARERWSGLAEVVKCALLAPAQDAGGLPLLERCERDLEAAAAGEVAALAPLIEACVRYKAGIVAADEREGAARAFLNLGHTVGHALEAATRYERFTHGEAVALGLRGALRLSCDRGLLDDASLQRALQLVARLKVSPDRRLAADEREAALAALARDKKARAGRLRFVLLAGLGAPRLVEVEPPECVRALEIYGTTTLAQLESLFADRARDLGLAVRAFQSNHEGALVDRLQEVRRWADGVVFNPGAFTHYSYALRDAIVGTKLRVVEVHLSDITKREPWRRVSVLSEVCAHRIMGKGVAGYLEALEWLAERIK